jgi:hypothetical protein
MYSSGRKASYYDCSLNKCHRQRANFMCFLVAILKKMSFPVARLSNRNMKVPSPQLADGRKGTATFKGTLKGLISHGDYSTITDCYIFDGIQPILSRQACFALNVLSSSVLPEACSRTATAVPRGTQAAVNTANVAAMASAMRAADTAHPAWKRLCTCFPRPLLGICRLMKGGPVTIKLCPGITPHNAYSTRVVPVNLQEAFDRELDEQLAAGILEEADDTNDHSEWLNPMCVTRKKDPTKCRITVNLSSMASRASIKLNSTRPAGSSPPLSPPAAGCATARCRCFKLNA